MRYLLFILFLHTPELQVAVVDGGRAYAAYTLEECQRRGRYEIERGGAILVECVGRHEFYEMTVSTGKWTRITLHPET